MTTTSFDPRCQLGSASRRWATRALGGRNSTSWLCGRRLGCELSRAAVRTRARCSERASSMETGCLPKLSLGFSVDSGQREGGPNASRRFPSLNEISHLVDVWAFARAGRIEAKRTLDDLPGPKGLPFLGNIHQLDLTKFHLILERWAAQYGPVYLFRMGSNASSPSRTRSGVIRSCGRGLKPSPGFHVAPVFSEMGVDGVFSAEGDAWRTQRRLATCRAGPASLARPYPKLQTVTTRLKKRWERLADAGASLDISTT